ncbi:MAG: hypothetical protein LQ349_001367 [Xanthoria aureola]|nr:MAG: hypothetical protein LQ349_001367 [Xanthoria aureola]
MAAREGSTSTVHEASAAVHVPRIIIKYCTQCKWMLRAAWYAQELLSTFSTTLGEVALVPATGGIFTVDIASSQLGRIQLWDRKTQGGFPEIKELKRLVRDIVEPTRDLGHVDHHGPSVKGDNQTEAVIPHQPHYQPPNQSSNAKNSVVPTTSVSLQRLTNDGGPSEPLTTAELAASRTAKKMVADIMKNFQEKVKHDGSGGRGAGSRAGVKGDGVEREAAQSEDELENKSGGSHSARQGCEDCE